MKQILDTIREIPSRIEEASPGTARSANLTLRFMGASPQDMLRYCFVRNMFEKKQAGEVRLDG